MRADLLEKKRAYLEAEKLWWSAAKIPQKQKDAMVGDITSALRGVEVEIGGGVDRDGDLSTGLVGVVTEGEDGC